jgi:threonine dehydratase
MTAALAELSLGTTVQPEVLLDNQTALELAAIMDELSVLNPADSVKREAFYEVVRATPLLVVSEEALPANLRHSGYTVYAKHEGAQHGGAYKLRGATNALLNRPSGTSKVTVASTGNHANETVIGAHAIDNAIEVIVECPEDISPAKAAEIQGNGGTLHAVHPDLNAALVAAEEASEQPGTIFIPPYHREDLVAAQGTIALEIIAQLLKQIENGELPEDAQVTFIYPGGGGGIGAGNAVAAKLNWPGAEFRISQMMAADSIAKALAGETLDPLTLDRSCDGAAVPTPGELPMRIISDPNFVDALDVVTKAQVGEAMAVLAQVHEVPEPAGALAMAAALRYMREHPRDPSDTRFHVVIPVTSGIVVTPEKVQEFMAAALAEGCISPQVAYQVVSQAYGERRVHGVDEVLARRAGTTALSVTDHQNRVIHSPVVALRAAALRAA